MVVGSREAIYILQGVLPQLLGRAIDDIIIGALLGTHYGSSAMEINDGLSGERGGYQAYGAKSKEEGPKVFSAIHGCKGRHNKRQTKGKTVSKRP